MSDVNDLQALTTSIGEYTLDTLGKETVTGLQVSMDGVDHNGRITVALKDNSDAEQKRVLRELFEIEQMYFDEAALSFDFVQDIDEVSLLHPEAKSFIYA
ncbi:hypothetical protein [Humibacter sp. RRB41]|uniref:hypothetical protein n=1 Tax=Humibacter sp. RRB41 TaxID=2919946 RepID=UPI001FAA18A0|nr:hypothetical protein [Humibacter sp. RRB41]